MRVEDLYVLIALHEIGKGSVVNRGTLMISTCHCVVLMIKHGEVAM